MRISLILFLGKWGELVKQQTFVSHTGLANLLRFLLLCSGPALGAQESSERPPTMCQRVRDLGCEHLLHTNLSVEQANRLLLGPSLREISERRQVRFEEAEHLRRLEYAQPVGSFLLRRTAFGGVDAVFVGVSHAISPVSLTRQLSTRYQGAASFYDVSGFTSRQETERYFYDRAHRPGAYILRLSGSRLGHPVLSEVKVFHLPIVSGRGAHELRWQSTPQARRVILEMLRLDGSACPELSFFERNRHRLCHGVLNRYTRSKVLLYLQRLLGSRDVTLLISEFLFHRLF